MSHDRAAFLDALKGNRHVKTHQASISQQVLSVWQSILLSFYLPVLHSSVWLWDAVSET